MRMAPERRLGPVVNVELPVEGGDVIADGVGGQVQTVRDLRVADALTDELQDLAFPLRQGFGAGVAILAA